MNIRRFGTILNLIRFASKSTSSFYIKSPVLNSSFVNYIPKLNMSDNSNKFPNKVMKLEERLVWIDLEVRWHAAMP